MRDKNTGNVRPNDWFLLLSMSLDVLFHLAAHHRRNGGGGPWHSGPPPAIPPVMQPLMCCCVAALDRLAVPGETVLTWLSLNIEAYISRLLVGVQRLEETVSPAIPELESPENTNGRQPGGSELMGVK